MSLEEVLKIKKSLGKAIQEEKISIAIEILKRLKAEVTITKELLQKTEIGVYINKQKTHANTTIANLAKEIVKKWKNDIKFDEPKKRSEGHTSNGTSLKAKPSASKMIVPKANPKTSLTNNNNRSSSQSSNQTPVTPSPDTPSSEIGDRTIAADGVKMPNTGDKKRDKVIEMLYNALAFDSFVDSETILLRASRIEAQILKQFGTPEKEYRDKLRGLIINLKDRSNPDLRLRVVNGELPIQTLCTMSKEEMASDEKKARDREIREKNLFNARGAGPAQAETDAFKCGKCGQRKTTYYQMQTRSADEPMTTFVTCVNCNNRWKF
ncbi:hypothetical protein G9A89_018566 [Geosiphon pyriformis]|nr:hypothetical protein G9A89_018566 [Geosiphon pyriformis]